MRFNATEHLYDGGAPADWPALDQLLADARQAGYAVELVHHVTSLPPSARDAAVIDSDRQQVRIVVPCPLADHGGHDWADRVRAAYNPEPTPPSTWLGDL